MSFVHQSRCGSNFLYLRLGSLVKLLSNFVLQIVIAFPDYNNEGRGEEAEMRLVVMHAVKAKLGPIMIFLKRVLTFS